MSVLHTIRSTHNAFLNTPRGHARRAPLYLALVAALTVATAPTIAAQTCETTGSNTSVALGQAASSIALRDNMLSVGSAGNERQVTNVAAGTEGTDAVNLDQLNSVAEVAGETSRFFQATGEGEAIVAGEDSVAVGGNAYAEGDYATAIGSSSSAIGERAGASGSGAVAIGTQATANGFNAVALADNTTASGFFSLASGDVATALGAESVASGNVSAAAGFRAEATGNFATSLGGLSTASGYNSTAVGNAATALGEDSAVARRGQ